jgi:carbon-monoxide dehydrogenase medium subunit
MRDFDWIEPDSAEAACAALARYGDEARLIAGGTALVIALRERIVLPQALVSLARIEPLRVLEPDPAGGLTLGAGLRHVEIAQSVLVRERYPMLAELASVLANPQVRHQGTLGGNLCYADPSTDPPGCLLALGAEVTLQGVTGQRRLPLSAFLVDYFETALAPDELLVSVHLPVPAAGFKGSYARHLRTAAEHRPMANVSVVSEGPLESPTAVRIAIGAATPYPVLAPEAATLAGTAPDARRLGEVAAGVADAIDAISDARADAAYRRKVVRALLARTLERHFGLDGGSA